MDIRLFEAHSGITMHVQRKTFDIRIRMRKSRYISDLVLLLFHPATGMKRIAFRYLKTVNTEYAKNYPKIACFSSDYVAIKIFLDGRYDAKRLDFLASKVFPKIQTQNKQSVCLDIGANIGNHALYLADHFDKIIAFEPHPKTYRLLEINAELVDNVVPVNKGCSNVKRKALAFEPLMNAGGTFISKDSSINSNGDAFNRIEFDLELLDDMKVVNDGQTIEFIKIDVEGHELECYEGAVNLLNRHKPVIACEVMASSISNGKSPAIEYLKKNNYRFIYELRKTRSWKETNFDLFLTDRLTHKHHSMLICSQYRLD